MRQSHSKETTCIGKSRSKAELLYSNTQQDVEPWYPTSGLHVTLRTCSHGGGGEVNRRFFFSPLWQPTQQADMVATQVCPHCHSHDALLSSAAFLTCLPRCFACQMCPLRSLRLPKIFGTWLLCNIFIGISWKERRHLGDASDAS